MAIISLLNPYVTSAVLYFRISRNQPGVFYASLSENAPRYMAGACTPTEFLCIMCIFYLCTAHEAAFNIFLLFRFLSCSSTTADALRAANTPAWSKTAACLTPWLLPGSLQVVPHGVLVTTGSQVQLLTLHNWLFTWKKINTLHPVISPLKSVDTQNLRNSFINSKWKVNK